MSDKSPSVEIKLSKPLAVSVFQFFYLDRDEQHKDKQFMREFELQFVAPTGSSKMFRTFAPVTVFKSLASLLEFRLG